jgi:hypothetical protein
MKTGPGPSRTWQSSDLELHVLLVVRSNLWIFSAKHDDCQTNGYA